MKSFVTAALSGLLFANASFASSETEWFQGTLEEAVQAAEKQDRLVMVYLWWDGSEHARGMRESTLREHDLQPQLKQFVCFDANHKRNGVPELFKKYNVQIGPTTLFLNGSGEPEEILPGSMHAGEFGRELERIAALGEGTVSFLRTAIETTKDDDDEIELRMQLAGKYDDLGNRDMHDATLLSIRELDPDARTTGGCRAALMHLQAGLNECSEGEQTCTEECQEGECSEECGEARTENWDLKPFYQLAKRAKSQDSRFAVWSTLVNLEGQRGDAKKRVAAIQSALKNVTAEQAGDWCHEIAGKIVAHSDDASKKERSLAVDLARRSIDATRAKQSASSEPEAWNSYLAERHAVLAKAYRINGKRKQAIGSAEDALKLDPSDRYRELRQSLK